MARLRRRWNLSVVMVLVAVVGVLLGVVNWPVAVVISIGIVAAIAVEGLTLIELLIIVSLTGLVAGLFLESPHPAHLPRRARGTAAPVAPGP